MPFQRSVARRYGAENRPGFTLIEVVIVVLIMGILGAIALPQFGQYTNKRAVNNARDAFIRTAAQARATAIRTGDRAEMHLDPAADMVVIVTGTDTVTRLDLRNGPIRANLVGTADSEGAFSTGPFRVCYVPQGFALPACGTHTVPRTVIFVSPAGADTARALVTVGQAEWQ